MTKAEKITLISFGPNNEFLEIKTNEHYPALQFSASTLKEVERQFKEHSVILIRNSGITNARSFSTFCARLFPDLDEYETGEHPAADKQKRVYEPVLYSPTDKLMWHHENSFNLYWPQIVAFACIIPARTGGETTLVNSQKVFSAAPSELIEEFERKKILYRRICDGQAGRSWQEIYGTSDWDTARQLAEERAERLYRENDSAWIECIRPAFINTTNGKVWFNQLLHWHLEALPEDVKELTRQGVIPQFRDCRFGDGSLIPPHYIEEIKRQHSAVEWAHPWIAGDMLLIKNDTISHGRNPYSGERRHFALFLGSKAY